MAYMQRCIWKIALDQLPVAQLICMSQNDVALCRLAQVDEARAKLQEALTHAERQLAASEARVTTLQSAVEKSEERAASLDLQVKAKSNPASGKHHFRPVVTLPLHRHADTACLRLAWLPELILS